MAIGLDDGTILLRDQSTGAEIARLREHSAPVVSVSFAAAGDRMASADLGGMVKVWQPNPGRGWKCARTIRLNPPIAEPPLDGPGILVAVSSDGKSLATYSAREPEVALWNLAKGTRTAAFALPGAGRLEGLTLSQQGEFLVAGYNGNDGYRLLVWEIARQTLKQSIASDIGQSTKSP